MTEELFSIIFFFIVLGTPFCGAQQCYAFYGDENEYICEGIVRQFPDLYHDAYKLRCDQCRIDHLDNETFLMENDLRTLNVSNSGIKYVGERSFRHCKSLQHLVLSDNRIGNISKGAFEGLSQLYELHLEGNFLETVEPGTLRGVAADFVNISGNSLEHLPAHAFEGIVMVLNLDLSRNRLRQLDKDSLDELASLETLDLSSNALCHLPLGVFKSLTGLKHLTLANNKFSKFNSGTFSGLNHINFLSLAQNSLVDFDPSVLLSINYLKHLDISSNNIRTFKAQNLLSNVPTLEVITLEDNIFSCGELKTALQLLKRKSITVQNNFFRFSCVNVGGIACLNALDSDVNTLGTFLERSEEKAKLEESVCYA